MRAVPGPGRATRGLFWPKLTIRGPRQYWGMSNRSLPGLGSYARVIFDCSFGKGLYTNLHAERRRFTSRCVHYGTMVGPSRASPNPSLLLARSNQAIPHAHRHLAAISQIRPCLCASKPATGVQTSVLASPARLNFHEPARLSWGLGCLDSNFLGTDWGSTFGRFWNNFGPTLGPTLG